MNDTEFFEPYNEYIDVRKQLKTNTTLSIQQAKNLIDKVNRTVSQVCIQIPTVGLALKGYLFADACIFMFKKNDTEEIKSYALQSMDAFEWFKNLYQIHFKAELDALNSQCGTVVNYLKNAESLKLTAINDMNQTLSIAIQCCDCASTRTHSSSSKSR